MPLAERSDVLGSLKELFEDCRAGKGQVALVSGGIATGKSELLHEFSTYAVESGALLLTAAGSRAESSLRMGIVDQLLRGAALPIELTDQLSRLVTVDALGGDPMDTDAVAIRDGDVRAAQGVCSALLELARDRPMVIGVDDVHLADNASLQVLLYLQRRMRSARILLILNELDRPWLTRPMLHAEVTRLPHHRIKLGPLSADGVAELLAHRMDADTSSELAAAYHSLSGGNPLLVHALVDDFGASTPTDRLGQPSHSVAFRQAVLSCLHRADPRLLTVARGMAMLGKDARTTDIARLTDLSSDAVTQALRELTSAGLVDSGAFRHPATVDAVLDSLAPEQRSQLHLSAADLLHQHGARSIEVARHLIAAEAVLGSWSVPVLRDAAGHALAERNTELAVQCLTLALRTAEDETDQLTIRNALARVEWQVSPAAAFRHLEPLRNALHQGDLSARESEAVLRALLWQGDTEALAKTLNVISDSGDPAAARIATEFATAHLWLYGKEPELAARVAGADQPDQWTTAVRSLGSLWHGADRAQVVRNAEYILQYRTGDTLLELSLTALLALIHTGKTDRAASWCDALLDDAARSRTTTWEAVLRALRAEIAYLVGDLVAAEAQASRAMSLLRPQSWGVLVGYPLSILLRANTAMGQQERCDELLREVVPEAMFNTIAGLRYLQARGHYYLATDRPLAALSEFQTCGRLVRQWGLDVPSVLAWRCDLAQAQLRLDRRKSAKQLLDEQRALVDPLDDPRSNGMALRVLAAASEPRQRPALLNEAVRVLESIGARLELSRALADLSHAYQELGETSRARAVGTRAEQEAKACHADSLAVRSTPISVERESGCATQGDETPVLSEAEQRVATLAALGHTNREIGRKLFITVSTVEQHLTRVYRKLNLNSRTDLPAGLSGQRILGIER